MQIKRGFTEFTKKKPIDSASKTTTNSKSSHRLRYLASLETAGADGNPLHPTVDARPHSLKVGIPPPQSFIVGMADIMTEAGLFPTDFTDPCQVHLTS